MTYNNIASYNHGSASTSASASVYPAFVRVRVTLVVRILPTSSSWSWLSSTFTLLLAEALVAVFGALRGIALLAAESKAAAAPPVRLDTRTLTGASSASSLAADPDPAVS